MSFLLDKHFDKIKNLQNGECWYIVRQDIEFWKQCYYTKVLLKYIKEGSEESLETFFSNEIKKINEENPNLILSTTHRALRVAYFYGLLKYKDITRGNNYINSEETEVYKKILESTNGFFEKEELYKDIKLEQIEKIYMSSTLDKEANGVRSSFDIFPVIFLYKILLELGISTEKYEITKDEYKYIVTVQKKYSDYLDTLVLIKETREIENPFERFREYKDKLDNRFNLVIEQLPTIKVEGNYYKLNLDYLDRIKILIKKFEENDFKENYLNFLIKPLNLFQEKDKINNDKNIPYQKIVYGAPGTGKSYSLNEETESIFGTNRERVTFYDGYTYGQFIGMYKPTMIEEGDISYKYVPGPFMKQLVKAYIDSENNFCLIIEEINRAKADKVFGNIFQLLDRDEKGNSRYPISTSEEQLQYLREELNNKKEVLERIETKGLYLPNNLYIWATMNSADDGVQPLDTAFKRRWKFNYISLNANEKAFGNEKEFIIGKYKGEFVFWNKFRKALNTKLKDRITEDRLIAPFFISPNDFDENSELGKKVLNKDIFIEKVLMYIFDDLLRHYPKKREQIFKNGISTFSDIVDKNKVNSEEEIQKEIKEEENFLEKVFLEDFIKEAFIKEEKLGVQNEGENSSN